MTDKNRRALSKAIGELALKGCRDVLLIEALKLRNLLTEKEQDAMLGDNPPVRLAKILICAVAHKIEDEFAAEATLKNIKRCKRILKNRS